ncbi:hypothetical protein BN2497_8001 [Janthinobacterium sp. CG23_2]|nr:hypothetical protein BN2497_8001 [Janthinobacterium sp. CG23_2]CUU30398.1 hypothetical protein BN3177_8001 [Janthinobacterium sp. CG23_2]
MAARGRPQTGNCPHWAPESFQNGADSLLTGARATFFL